jgi:hypothetical protein
MAERFRFQRHQRSCPFDWFNHCAFHENTHRKQWLYPRTQTCLTNFFSSIIFLLLKKKPLIFYKIHVLLFIKINGRSHSYSYIYIYIYIGADPRIPFRVDTFCLLISKFFICHKYNSQITNDKTYTNTSPHSTTLHSNKKEK